ncbi:hypothetical protein NKDENANG_03696 [Candidatus Entotheonellaceae bacterium PAL068K]
MWFRIPGNLFLAVALVLLIAACGTKSEVASSSAGEITVYTDFPPDQVSTYLALFNADYPNIKVNVVGQATSDLTRRLFILLDEPQTDVIWGLSVTTTMLLAWYDRLASYAPAGLEHVSPKFRDSHHPPYWMGLAVRVLAFCVNTAALETLDLPPPRSWRDLIRPIYAGHLVMPSPITSETGYIVVAGLLHTFDEIESWKLLDALHQNVAQYTSSATQACDLAAAGQVPIGISFVLAGLQQQSKGAPIKVILPLGGARWGLATSALVMKDQIKPAAKTFLDWAISDHAMRAYRKHYAVTAAHTGLAIPQGLHQNPCKQLLNTDLLWTAANRDRILQEWLQRRQ